MLLGYRIRLYRDIEREDYMKAAKKGKPSTPGGLDSDDTSVDGLVSSGSQTIICTCGRFKPWVIRYYWMNL